MTPDQIIADLRDIHLPEAAASAASVDLVLWPLVLVVLAALTVAWLIWRRRSAWRLDFFDELDRIDDIAVKQGGREGWAKLALLLKRLAIQRLGRHDVAALSGEPWLKQLDDLVGSDLFTEGPGQGLITFPYLAASADRRMVDDLKATIEALRHQLPRRGKVPRPAMAPSQEIPPGHGMARRQGAGG